MTGPILHCKIGPVILDSFILFRTEVVRPGRRPGPAKGFALGTHQGYAPLDLHGTCTKKSSRRVFLRLGALNDL